MGQRVCMKKEHRCIQSCSVAMLAFRSSMNKKDFNKKRKIDTNEHMRKIYFFFIIILGVEL